ncbi:MAG: UDP-3-O-(3-hydroxymyristoyl)glucosamine N-acyltransferase, partial [Gammaproteobacteria bacterium]|nr:UDP-3-O-(3-hydroxymyristoyl)glucosamine N-acyltransferase [Gammaproteobacteria bacterium]
GKVYGDPETRVNKVATLQLADASGISFLSNSKYASQLAATSAGIVIAHPDMAPHCPTAALLVDDPYLVYAKVAALLHPSAALHEGVHPKASVADDAIVPASCEIAAGAVIDSGVVLGEQVYVGANCYIGSGTSVGSETRLMANVTLYHEIAIGERCLIHSATVVGSDGFGNARNKDGSWTKVPQVGSVTVGNDVELGSACTIDRGAIDDTIIADGVRLDNQVHVAHNVQIGQHTAVAGQAGFSGSTTVGARCQIGGASSISGHIEICDDVGLMGKSGVAKNIDKPGIYSNGILPLETAVQHNKNAVRFRQLDKMARMLRKIEKKVLGDSDS